MNPISLEPRLQAALDTYRVLKELAAEDEPCFSPRKLGRGGRWSSTALPGGASVNVERFEREIQLAARLRTCTSFPLAAAASGDLLYYIMPYMRETASAKLAREGEPPVARRPRSGECGRPLPTPNGTAWCNATLPDNAAFGRHAVVTDFGVAKAVTASSGKSPDFLGSHRYLAYMAPSRWRPISMDIASTSAPWARWVRDAHWSDPVRGTPYRRPCSPPITQALNGHQHRPAGPGVERRSDALLEKRPADRWQSAGELLAQLEAATTPSTGA